MGLMTGNFPPVDPETFMRKPYRERLRTLATHWVDYGFGSPKAVMLIYVLRLVVFFAFGGILVGTLTSGLNPLHPAAWFFQPIFYEKVILWTVLLECLGLAGSWGPLAGHFQPMTGGWRYYARRGTIRMPPWPEKVPFTKGDERTTVDVALYVGADRLAGRRAGASGRPHARHRSSRRAQQGPRARRLAFIPVIALLGDPRPA